MRVFRIVAGLALVLTLAVANPAPAIAKACWSETDIDAIGNVTVRLVCEDDAQGEGLSSNPGKRVCMFGQWEVPCKSDQGSWYSPRQCYISLVDPQPPFSNPAWEGHTTGTLYYCRLSGLGNGTPLLIRLEGSTPPPDPEQLAREAVRRMQLKPITIGIVPNDDPDSVGLVGMPIWLWVEDPGDQTIGPISRSVSDGGYTVSATAEVERIRWSMGDGGVKTCTGPGTPYKLKFGITESPTCGYRFETQGTFAVTARSDWVVRWRGIGETGTFRLSLSESTQVVIGELNVVTVSGGS